MLFLHSFFGIFLNCCFDNSDIRPQCHPSSKDYYYHYCHYAQCGRMLKKGTSKRVVIQNIETAVPIVTPVTLNVNAMTKNSTLH